MVSATVLALVAAIFFSFQAIAVEYGFKHHQKEHTTPGVFAAMAISVMVSAVALWGIVMLLGGPLPFDQLWLLAPFVVAGVGNPTVTRLFYYVGIDRVGARLSVTMVSLYPAVTALLAAPMLGERLTFGVLLGLAFILIGAILLQTARSPGPSDSNGDEDLLRLELRQATTRDFVYPITSMFILGVSYILVKIGLNEFPHPVVATAVTQTAALFGVTLLLVTSGTARRRVVVAERSALIAFILSGLFIVGSYITLYIAMNIGTVSRVIPLVNVYPLFVVAFSYIIARELPRSPRILTAIVVIVAGITIIQLY
jgi:drug/metabolite transporter (DMT)-like permease